MEALASPDRPRLASREELDEIRSRLKEYFPKSAVIYGILKALTAYEGMWDLLGTQVYYCDYSSLVAGTPSDYQCAKQTLYLFWDEEEEDDEEVAMLLSRIPALDWSKPVFLCGTPLSLVRKVENFVTTGLLGYGLLKPSEAMILQMYSLSSMPSIDMELPEGFEFRDLTEEHAEFLLDHWQYKHISTLHRYRCMRRTLPGVGVFKTSHGNNNGEPVAWAQLSFWNMYTNTFTLPQYRRQGLAAMATLALARKSLEKTGVALAPIFPDNVPSAEMHLKLGFKRSVVIANQSYCP
ncbi:uncharacterized protein [Macrobrachium rosenbergii]|uniref:uncharacterized protein isoform X1 n=2 Tax=Macrobrachium rosenbergii TaxID=79674 RepID=UPI0034D74739